MHTMKNLLCINKLSLLMSYSLILLLNLLIFKCNLMTSDNSLLISYLLTSLLNLMIFFHFHLFIKKMLLLLLIIKSMFFKVIYLLSFKN